jgi:hypothetical protein
MKRGSPGWKVVLKIPCFAFLRKMSRWSGRRKHYGVVTLPTMSTGATDMAYLRAKGIQSYGIGPMTDVEDGPKGFGAHSDQERILESALHTFFKFHWDAVIELAAAGKSSQ